MCCRSVITTLFATQPGLTVRLRPNWSCTTSDFISARLQKSLRWISSQSTGPKLAQLRYNGLTGRVGTAIVTDILPNSLVSTPTILRMQSRMEARVTYIVQTRWGSSEEAPTKERLREILRELDQKDPEHPDAWLTHESGWTLAVHEDGRVVLDNAESREAPRHLAAVEREKALWMWLRLARGDLAEIERLPWQPGYGPPIDAEERTRRDEAARQATLALHRRFYEGLGAENTDQLCIRSGCGRGAIQQSLMCRVHHFENVMRVSCPFSD